MSYTPHILLDLLFLFGLLKCMIFSDFYLPTLYFLVDWNDWFAHIFFSYYSYKRSKD